METRVYEDLDALEQSVAIEEINSFYDRIFLFGEKISASDVSQSSLNSYLNDCVFDGKGLELIINLDSKRASVIREHKALHSLIKETANNKPVVKRI